MTTEEILLLPASRALNELVAAIYRPKPTDAPNYCETGKVIGPWIVVHIGAGVLEWQCALNYSADIAAAWKIVEKLTVEGWGHKHQVFSAAAEMPGWQWTFMRPGGPHSISGAEGETAPLAICRAALLATLS